jgi:hypothetical protein
MLKEKYEGAISLQKGGSRHSGKGDSTQLSASWSKAKASLKYEGGKPSKEKPGEGLEDIMKGRHEMWKTWPHERRSGSEGREKAIWLKPVEDGGRRWNGLNWKGGRINEEAAEKWPGKYEWRAMKCSSK